MMEKVALHTHRKIYAVTDRLKSDKSKRLYKYLFKCFLEYILSIVFSLRSSLYLVLMFLLLCIFKVRRFVLFL
jgi:hypothetical protein